MHLSIANPQFCMVSGPLEMVTRNHNTSPTLNKKYLISEINSKFEVGNEIN